MRKTTWLSGILLLLLGACTQVDVTMPKGEQGDPGLSAYEYWKSKVADGTIKWPAEAVELADYMKYIKGDKGRDGANGESAYDLWRRLVANPGIDNPHKAGEKWPASENTQADFYRFLTGATGESGQIPHVGEDGNWYVGTRNTGQRAKGKEATPPTVEAIDGYWYINGVKMPAKAVGADGKNGKNAVMPTVIIGTNGNWFVDGIDQGKPAHGADGKKPEIYIDAETKKWVIDGRPTPESAFGKDGRDGRDGIQLPDGMSAYELWVEEIAKGEMPYPGLPGAIWPADKNSVSDFWEFLNGRPRGDGAPSEIGTPGDNVRIVLGAPNVVAQYYMQDKSEYVSPYTGAVRYKVYDDRGQIAPGAVVKGMPGMDPEKSYTADANGEFEVPAADLPSIQALSPRLGSVASVTYGGKTVASVNNTYVPNRIRARIVVKDVKLDGEIDVTLRLERKVNPDDEWASVPYYISYDAGTLSSSGALVRKYMSFNKFRVLDLQNPHREGGVESKYDNRYEGYTLLSRSYELDENGNQISEDADFIDEYHLYALFNKYENPDGLTETNSWGKSMPRDLYYQYRTTKQGVIDNSISETESQGRKAEVPSDLSQDGLFEIYGETEPLSNAVIQMIPIQAAPFVKSIKLKGRSVDMDGKVFFSSAEITLDDSEIDYSQIYKSAFVKTVSPTGVEVWSAEPMPKEDVLNEYSISVGFYDGLGGVSQNSSSLDNLVITVHHVMLGSTVTVGGVSKQLDGITVGKLVESAPNQYEVEIEPYDDVFMNWLEFVPGGDVRYHVGYPKIHVTYEE